MNILFNLKQKFEKFDENWRSDLEKTFSSLNKKSAEKHAFWIDHEFLRIFYHNNFQIAPGVFRSNQPSEKRILEWQREKGIQSIINFRGESNQGAFFIEKNICKLNGPIYCTKIASKLTRTFGAKHGLADLCKDLLNLELDKQNQTSDWGSENLSESQLKYAASDVLYLHQIKNKLDQLLVRENKEEIAQKCFEFLKIRSELDLIGFENLDIFAH